MSHTRQTDEQEGAFNSEHLLAWVFALAAAVFAVIGLLVGFGIVAEDSQEVADGAVPGDFLDGMLWLLAALSSGVLAMTLHRTEHHLGIDPRDLDEREKGLWGTEHALAYGLALASVATGFIGLLVGFDVISQGRDRYDGILWLVASNTAAFLAFALHGVRHHQVSHVVQEHGTHESSESSRYRRGTAAR